MSEPTVPTAAESQVPAVIWESLFVRGLQLEAPALEALRTEGLDLHHLPASASLELFSRCVRVVHAHVFPGLSEAQVYRELGRRTMQGFLSTLLGRVMATGFPLLGPVRFLKRMPQTVKVTGVQMHVVHVPLGEQEHRLEFRSTRVTPEYAAGLVERGLELSGAQPQVQAQRQDALGFDLLVRW